MAEIKTASEVAVDLVEETLAVLHSTMVALTGGRYSSEGLGAHTLECSVNLECKMDMVIRINASGTYGDTQQSRRNARSNKTVVTISREALLGIAKGRAFEDPDIMAIAQALANLAASRRIRLEVGL